MEKLLEILHSIKPDVDFESKEDLISDHTLDSMSIVMLVANLNDEYDIEITPLDVVPENFKNISAISALIERLENE